MRHFRKWSLVNIFLADHDVGVAGRGEVTGDGSLMLNKPKPKAGDKEAGNVLVEHESLASPCRSRQRD